MPTTTIVDSTFKAAALQARTNSAGAAATDVDGEELRLFAELLTEGILTEDAFEPNPGGGMSVAIGSGNAKEDVAVVAGTVAGQGNYLVRLDVGTVSVTITAADLTNPRIDEIYLYVADNAYDAGARTLPRIGYRRGDAAASPSAPGPDAAWDAYLLLATVNVTAGLGTVGSGNITDERPLAEIGVAAPLPTASTTTAGIVQLSNSYAGVLQTRAVTEKALSDGLATKQNTHSHPYLSSGGGTLSGILFLDGGSEANPGVGFATDGNSGFYSLANDGIVHWAGNGVEGGQLSALGLRTVSGSAATPSRGFIGDTDTGSYLAGTNAYGIAAGGAQMAKFQLNDIRFPGRAMSSDSGLSAWRQDAFGGDELIALGSSKRWKKDIKDYPAEKAAEMLRALAPRNYRSTLEYDDSRRVMVGLIAEEVEEVDDYFVGYDQEGLVSQVAYEGFITPLIAGWQDLDRRLAALESAES